jgi:hypothetical protein
MGLHVRFALVVMHVCTIRFHFGPGVLSGFFVRISFLCIFMGLSYTPCIYRTHTNVLLPLQMSKLTEKL